MALSLAVESCPEMVEPQILETQTLLLETPIETSRCVESLETGAKGGPIDWFPPRNITLQSLIDQPKL